MSADTYPGLAQEEGALERSDSTTERLKRSTQTAKAAQPFILLPDETAPESRHVAAPSAPQELRAGPRRDDDTLDLPALLPSTRVPDVSDTPQADYRFTFAQRRSSRQLAQLAPAGIVTLDVRLIPDSEDHIHHLVIGPFGVLAIDSEYWDKKLPIRTKSQQYLWHGPFSMEDRLEHAQWKAQQASELLSTAIGRTVSVYPAMAIYGPKISWDRLTVRDVDLFIGLRVRTYLRHRSRTSGTPQLTEEEVREISEAAARVLPAAASAPSKRLDAPPRVAAKDITQGLVILIPSIFIFLMIYFAVTGWP